MSNNNYDLMFLMTGRLIGFFLLSPLFSQRAIPKSILFFIAIGCALILAPPLLGPTQTFEAIQLKINAQTIIGLLKEVAIGFFMGFMIAILFEAAALGGEILGVLMGISATEILDPISSARHPLMGLFFSLIAFTLFFSLDLHHSLIRYLFASFNSFPLGEYPITAGVVKGAIQASGQLFRYALEFSLLPMLILLMLIALFALLSRFFSIFWAGIPLQILIGLLAICSSLYLFAPTLKAKFKELLTMIF